MSDKLEALVDDIIDGCTEVFQDALAGIDCPATQNAAVSAVGMSIASSTLRNVTDEAAANKIAKDLVASFAAECALVLAEVWSDREKPQ